MQLLFFSSSHLPHPTGNGNSVLTEALVQCFLKLSFEVTVVPVQLQYASPNLEKLHRESLEQRGIKVRYFDSIAEPRVSRSRWQTLRRLTWPSADDYFYSALSLKSELREFLESLEEPTALVSYHWPAVVLTSNLLPASAQFLKVACLVDPIDRLPAFAKSLGKDAHTSKPHRRILNRLLARKRGFYASATLKHADVIVQHASHHAEELQRQGYKKVHYIPHPLPKQRRIERQFDATTDSCVTILILGSLKGVASRLGFTFFLDQILPELKRRSDELRFPIEFRIVGHGKMPHHLKERLTQEPLVKFVGFVESIAEEYQKADIVLVNIPVNLGFRTRIAEAFSYGLCVVTHEANAAGMPEICDGKNALSHSKPSEIVDRLIDVINHPQRRVQLGAAAQETFNESMSQDTAVLKLARIFDDEGFLPPLAVASSNSSA